MNLQQMKRAFESRVDDTADMTDLVEWLNSAKNDMAIAAKAIFPDIDQSNLDDSFVFDERYHEAPVIYACARFKEQDSSLNEAIHFQNLYETKKKEFVSRYVVPVKYQDDSWQNDGYETDLKPAYSWQGHW